jgi:hypothetical protein
MDDIRGRVFDDNAKSTRSCALSKRSPKAPIVLTKRYAALVAEEAGKYGGERRRELERMAGSLALDRGKTRPHGSGSRLRPF